MPHTSTNVLIAARAAGRRIRRRRRREDGNAPATRTEARAGSAISQATRETVRGLANRNTRKLLIEVLEGDRRTSRGR